jgi:hypothetical protein
MGPLFLVDWHVVNIRFRALMWCVALVLVVVILLVLAREASPATHAPRAWSSPAAPIAARARP